MAHAIAELPSRNIAAAAPIPAAEKKADNSRLQSHLAELEKKHKDLEEDIKYARSLRSADHDLHIVELKRKKLAIKDKMERLRRNHPQHVH
ncbi:MAG: DUF465 domain-containing protein [Proteobacteria bacterium]|nr:DUF465 domain-containing protein [Pseudomonadota bacterium]